jgi:RNA polymerase sigma factor (sigma-70 family)
MATGLLSGALDQLRKTALARDGAGLTDAQLLECFLTRRDAAAFEALVRRHGPTVLGVCRRVLRNLHDAEDAFQATFLVLVRKATCIRHRESVGSWLYGTAYRAALEAKAVRRRSRETQVSAMPEPEVTSERVVWADMRPVLDQELSGLGDKFQEAIVLCDVEGKTRKEAARQLGIPEGTLSGRLTTARRMLARRLARRGLTLSVGALAVALSQGAASACVPRALVISTVKAATATLVGRATAAGVISARVAALTKGVLDSMFLNSLKTTTAVIMGTFMVLGLGAFGSLSLAQPGVDKPPGKTAGATARGAAPAPMKRAWQESLTMKQEHPVTIIAFTPDWIAGGDEAGNLFLWDEKTGKEQKLLAKGRKDKDYPSTVDRLQFTPDGKQLFAVLDGRRTLCRFDVKDPDKSPGVGQDQPHWIGTSADGETWLEIAAAGQTLLLRPNVWTRGAAADYETVEYKSKIRDAILSADDKWLAAVTEDGELHIHDRASLRETQTVAVTKRTITAVQFSKEGERVAVASEDGFAKIYDLTNGKEIAALKHGGLVFAIAFSPDGKTLVSGGDDNTARVWDTATGKQLDVLKGHKDSVRSVAFASDDETIITGSADKSIKVWTRSK